MPYLAVSKPKRRGVRRVEMAGEPMTIGRDPSNRIVLSHDSVSRRHCVIETTGGVTRVRDLGSRHGIHINRKRHTECELIDGDCIRVGPYELTFLAAAIADDGGDEDRDSASASADELARLKAERAELIRRAREAEDGLASSQASAQAAREQADEATTRIAAIEKVLAKAEEALRTARDRTAAAERDRADLEPRLAQIESERDGALEKATTSERDRTDLEARLSQAEAERDAPMQQAVALEASLDQTKGALAQAETDAARAQAGRDALQRKLNESHPRQVAQAAELKETRQRLVTAQGDLVAARKRLSECSTLIANYRDLLSGAEVVEVEEIEEGPRESGRDS